MSESKGSKKMTVQRVKERRGGRGEGVGGRDKEVERTRKEERGTSTGRGSNSKESEDRIVQRWVEGEGAGGPRVYKGGHVSISPS